MAQSVRNLVNRISKHGPILMAAGQPRPSISLEDLLQDSDVTKYCRQRSLPSLLLLTLGPGWVLVLWGTSSLGKPQEMRLRSCTPALYAVIASAASASRPPWTCTSTLGISRQHRSPQKTDRLAGHRSLLKLSTRTQDPEERALGLLPPYV